MVQRISSPSRTKEIIERYGFSFKKNYGQNFLIDGNILDKIVEASQVDQEDFVLEIGPGIGSLTQVLAERAKKVVAVEIDKKLIPILQDTLAGYDNVEVIEGDVLKLDLNRLIDEKNGGKPIRVVANLPYYITTPILMELLEKKVRLKSITVMVQKEVAERLAAPAGSKEYGALTVAVQYYCGARLDLIVPPSCFMPRPKVASAVITLDVSAEPTVKVKDEGFFFGFVKCAFSQRRKTLLNCLSHQGGYGLDKETIKEVLQEAGFDERVRGEALTIEEFAKLSDLFYDRKRP